jgi:hypothetical protein
VATPSSVFSSLLLQHRRLVASWFHLHRLSKSEVGAFIASLFDLRRFDEVVVAVRAIFLDQPPPSPRGTEREPLTSISSSQEEAALAGRGGPLEEVEWEAVDMREKGERMRAVVMKAVVGMQLNDGMSEQQSGECVEIIKAHMQQLSSRVQVNLVVRILQNLPQSKVTPDLTSQAPTHPLTVTVPSWFLWC